jgi:circadian clock protein KaiC
VSSHPPTSPESLARMATGLEGLDAILKGGFLRGSMAMIMGAPGTGKTILGNQVAFNHVAAGGRAVYVTLLAEEHSRMLLHLKSLDFFDPALVNNGLDYFSGYSDLEQGGVSGLLDLLRNVIDNQQPSLLVLDGLAPVGTRDELAHDFQGFVHTLQAYLALRGCTALLMVHLADPLYHPASTLVDSLLKIEYELVGMRAVRFLQVLKLRGSDFLAGQHVFDISEAGIVVHPRIETVLVPGEPLPTSRARAQFGLPNLDEMLQGGLLPGTSTLMLGAPGTGKTTLEMHFLAAGARAGEPGLYFGFYEPPTTLIAGAEAAGLRLEELVTEGRIELLWQQPLRQGLDKLAEQLLEAVERRQVKRLVIDGLNGFVEASLDAERLPPFLAVLLGELRARGVTALITGQASQFGGRPANAPVGQVLTAVDNLIVLRALEVGSQFHRLIAIRKSRGAGSNPDLREFTITEQGINVAASPESAQQLLSDRAQFAFPNSLRYSLEDGD